MVQSYLADEGVLLVDLVRNISYDVDGIKRPTKVLFSADSANPYEIAPIAPLLGNLTCNPGIVYDFIHQQSPRQTSAANLRHLKKL